MDLTQGDLGGTQSPLSGLSGRRGRPCRLSWTGWAMRLANQVNKSPKAREWRETALPASYGWRLCTDLSRPSSLAPRLMSVYGFAVQIQLSRRVAIDFTGELHSSRANAAGSGTCSISFTEFKEFVSPVGLRSYLGERSIYSSRFEKQRVLNTIIWISHTNNISNWMQSTVSFIKSTTWMSQSNARTLLN